MKVWLNGKILDEHRATLSVFDHAFLYGDGLYETVRFQAGVIQFWPAHYSRLKKSARYFKIAFPWTQAALARAVVALTNASQRPAATVRLTLSRGTGPLGLDPGLCSAPTLVIQLHPERDLERWRREGVSAGIVPAQRATRERLDPGFKSTSMQNLVLAKMEAQRLRVFEGILLNAKGEITEGLTSNVFFIRDHALHTPAISCGLLPGITRAHVLRLAQRAGLPSRQGRYQPADLFQAQELFLTNASFAIVPVTLLKMGKRSKRFTLNGPESLIRQLQAAFIK